MGSVRDGAGRYLAIISDLSSFPFVRRFLRELICQAERFPGAEENIPCAHLISVGWLASTQRATVYKPHLDPG